MSEAIDRAAEAWLIERHSRDWYLGDATELEWQTAYAAVETAYPAVEGYDDTAGGEVAQVRKD